jgi:hypothetical protein
MGVSPTVLRSCWEANASIQWAIYLKPQHAGKKKRNKDMPTRQTVKSKKTRSRQSWAIGSASRCRKEDRLSNQPIEGEKVSEAWAICLPVSIYLHNNQCVSASASLALPTCPSSASPEATNTTPRTANPICFCSRSPSVGFYLSARAFLATVANTHPSVIGSVRNACS